MEQFAQAFADWTAIAGAAVVLVGGLVAALIKYNRSLTVRREPQIETSDTQLLSKREAKSMIEAAFKSSAYSKAEGVIALNFENLQKGQEKNLALIEKLADRHVDLDKKLEKLNERSISSSKDLKELLRRESS